MQACYRDVKVGAVYECGSLRICVFTDALQAAAQAAAGACKGGV
jgi:hypothetical protein